MKTFYTFLLAALITNVANSQSFKLGDQVQATATLNIRSTANGTSIGQHVSGDKGTIIGGPTYSAVSGYSGWWYQVQWQTSPTTGWCVQDYLQKVAGTPVISNVSPNPVPGSGSQQTLTINGNNFTSGCTITLKDLTNGGTYQKTPTFINSSQIQITANFTNTTATWSVQVTSPTSSNVFQFQVNATTVAPVISNVSPNPVPGSGSQQTLTINGNNFTSGCTITLKDLTNGGTYQKSTTFINSSQIQITANFTNTTSTWSVQVTSPTSSNVFQFQVNATTVAPVISSVNPSPVPGSSSQQTLTINGNNFTSGCTITLKDLTNGGTYQKTPTFINSSQIQITANFTNTTATWSVQVTSPASSNVFQFQVNAITVAPVISSVNPNPVPGSTLQQTIIINGSNFVGGCLVTLKDITNNDGPYIKETKFISSSQIQITANFTNATASWTAQVTSPSISNVFPFKVNSSGSVGISIPYFFSQKDPRWSSKNLGSTGNYDMGGYGCAVSCVAMLLKWVNGINYDISPQILNEWLRNNNGYDNDDNIKWENSDKQDGASGLIWINRTDGTDEWSIIDNELNNGYKPIVKVKYRGKKYWHYVIIYDKDGPSGSPHSYKILDPIDLQYSPDKRLDFHSSESGTIFGIRKFKGAPSITYPTPIINNVNSNNIVSGLEGDQDMYLNGANFDNGATIKLTWKIGTPTSKTLSSSQFTIVSNSQIKMTINTTNVSDFWTVEVINPDGQTTGQFPFNVVASGGQTTSKIIGVDVSHHNGTINWTNVKNAGYTFAFIKCTESIEAQFEDNLFKQNVENAVKAGLVIGAYHIATPFYNSASDEANHFLSIGSQYIKNGNLPPIIDLEPYYVNQYIAAGHSYSDLSSWIQSWINIVDSRTVIYTTGDVAKRLDNSLKKYSLWIADGNGIPDQPNTLGVWADWKFHQYFAPCDLCASNNPLSGMDQNIFNGDINAFNALINYSPIPLVLKSFNGNSEGCNSYLKWVSSLERNFSYYAVERSEDGVHFSEITKIQPKSGESMEKEYSFVDMNPGSKTLMYRLRMVDKDGQSNYSNIISIELDCLKQSTVSIFPTISRGVFNYKLLPGMEKVEITVFNTYGQVVYKYLPSAISGSFNLNNLSSGIYIVRVINNNNVIETRKIIIAR